MGNSVGYYNPQERRRSSASSDLLEELECLRDASSNSSSVRRLSITCLDVEGQASRLQYRTLMLDHTTEHSSNRTLNYRDNYRDAIASLEEVGFCLDPYMERNIQEEKSILPPGSQYPELKTFGSKRSSVDSSICEYRHPGNVCGSYKSRSLEDYRHEHDLYVPMRAGTSMPLDLRGHEISSYSDLPLYQCKCSCEDPIIYSATNARDWGLGTIPEELSGEEQSKDASPIREQCNSSIDDDDLNIGSVVNAADINGELEKEEGIQKCLDYFEKTDRIDECITRNSLDRKQQVQLRSPQRENRETNGISAVIEGGNSTITYLHLGEGLDEDVQQVVSSEYSQDDLYRSGGYGEDDIIIKEIRLYINEDHPGSVEVLDEDDEEGIPNKMNSNSSEVGDAERDDITESYEDEFEEAMEMTEVTESWTQPVAQSNVAVNQDHSESVGNQVSEDLNQLRIENDKLQTRNRSLQREVEELRRVKESTQEEDLQLKPKVNQLTVELHHAKEALSALKADRKRLKAEKFDLLNQMKQLYATLEDKEKELRDFIRNYEQRMKESDESLRHLAAERDETEREKWNILKHARDEAERAVKLSAELNQKETSIKRLHEELDMVRKQLSSLGYLSDAESCRTNGLPTPTASTPTCSPLPLSTPTPTPNGRGSSADSGVRLSSDRDSTASHDGGPGTPKESPSLSPLYATPVSTQRGGEVIQGMLREAPPDNMAQLSAAPSLNSTLSGLANSGSSGGLSRSAEQLCERLSESGETPKLRGTATLLRNKGHKSGGTWGSISRVFARQKKRAPLDSSIYDGAGGGGGGCDKRSSWSPSSSLCASPLTEESYSEKLRLLEEAQHIPLERWKATTVLAWLEVTLGMPQYGAMCAENVRSGKVLLELSDSELEVGLGIQHPMHRKKLRLAIEELREPRLTRFPRISALNHTWVSSEWLPDLGLPQYSESFANNLVDGRLLEALTKKELEKHLGVQRKFHQASIIHGVHLLRIVRFDRQVLAERRRQCENVDIDPVVWTNHRWIRWARSIDLTEYADNLKDSGVHGALVVLETSFTADTMATALGIPQSKNIIRRHLATELESLVQPARLQLEEQARYAKLERRRQEKLAAGGSLGRSFSRSYGTGLEKGDKEKRRASLRGSLSRALGLRMREEAAANGGESSSSGGQSPSVTSRIYAHPHLKQATRPRSSHIPSTIHLPHETHRRVKSISDIESITVTPV